MHTRIAGFDYIRALMSVFVVVWHMEGGGRSLIFSRQRYLEHVFTLSDLVNFHLLLLAVPVFLLVANFLYASRPIDNLALLRRLKRIVILLTFWPPVFMLAKHGTHGFIQHVPTSFGSLVVFILGAGDTIYYFFVCLIASTMMTHYIARLRPGSQCVGAIVSVVLHICLPWLTMSSGFYPLSAYWSPLNVIPFSFAAVLVARNIHLVESKKIILVSACGVLTIFFAVLEWHYAVGEVFFPGQGYAIPAYTRSSLLFSSLGILTISIDYRIKLNRIVDFMSRYSLALFCIHPFLIDPVKSIVSLYLQDCFLVDYTSIILVILLSYSLAIVLRGYLKDSVIM